MRGKNDCGSGGSVECAAGYLLYSGCTSGYLFISCICLNESPNIWTELT